MKRKRSLLKECVPLDKRLSAAAEPLRPKAAKLPSWRDVSLRKAEQDEVAIEIAALLTVAHHDPIGRK